ncbi:MAG: ferrous iron transport protein B [Lachnospiraceae bacterium]|nr:ferrous iron transport protein B [Lachnospiraceae bacterium]
MSIKIALAGNPNSGKTTLFNQLTGNSQYVGNWPGVTVEKKEGKLKGHKGEVIIQDLPGIYSLSPYTLEEVVSRTYLVNERPDAILNIVDGTNFERNLYLTTQLMELGIPLVIAVNMMDVVRKNGDRIDVKKIGQQLGCAVIEISALKGEGGVEAAEKAVEAAKKAKFAEPLHVFTGSVEHAIAHIEESIESKVAKENLRWYAMKLFERDSKVQEELNFPADLMKHIEEHIAECENELDDDAESIITNQRYSYIAKLCENTVQKKAALHDLTISDRIDRIVTNRILGLPIFAGVMFLVFWVAMNSLGAFLTDFVNDTVFADGICAVLGDALDAAGVAPWLAGLVNDGIVAGVGAVLGFVPQMLVLFLMLSILEQIGYMARVAFVLDRIFRKFGLSGKSFIPMLVGVGCGVPGIMASRTIENEKDRRMTVMTTTFIPCGAKMPIIAMIAGAMFPAHQGLVSVSAYFIGIAAIVVSGIMLKKTKPFAGDPAPFVMELPAYRIPTLGSILRPTWERGWSFIKRAGTIILAATVLIWFLQGFGMTGSGFGMVADADDSILAAIGNAVCIIFRPAGFGNWRATVAAVTGLIAKENVVGTFGILYGGFDEVAEDGAEIWAALQAAYTPLAAFSFMIFNLLCAPCFAAMGAIRREMNNNKWFWAAIGYQCILAYTVSIIVYQIGCAVAGNVHPVGLVIAIIILAFYIYMLVRKNPYQKNVGVEVTA